MTVATGSLRDRLRFPVGGRSAGRVRRDGRQMSRSGELTYNQCLNALARRLGIPCAWDRALDYLEQYGRVAPLEGAPLPLEVASQLVPNPGRMTLLTGGQGASLHAAGRAFVLDERQHNPDRLTAVVYRDPLLAPNKRMNIGNEPTWFHGDEITDLLNNELLPIDEAMALADEMKYRRDRMDEGILSFNEWRTQVMANTYLHSSQVFPAPGKFRWTDKVLYLETMPVTLSATTDALTACELGGRTVCLNNLVNDLDDVVDPVTWGLKEGEAFSAVMNQFIGKVDFIANRQKVIATADGSVIAHAYAVVPTDVSASVRDGSASLTQWKEAVVEAMVPFTTDIERQIDSGYITKELGVKALDKIEGITGKDSLYMELA